MENKEKTNFEPEVSEKSSDDVVETFARKKLDVMSKTHDDLRDLADDVFLDLVNKA